MSDPSPPLPTGAAPLTGTAERRVQTICLLVLTVIAIGASLKALSGVMIPFALAMFLSIALAPIVDGLAARTRLSRTVSVGLTMLLGALLLAVLGGIVASSLKEFEEIGGATQVEVEGGFVGALMSKLPEKLQAYFTHVDESVSNLLPMLAGVLGTLLSQGITVLIFLMFLLVEQGRPRPGETSTVQGTAREGVKQYISVKILTSAATGILVGVSLALIGVPAAVLFGVLTFLLNFIPTIGSIIAVALPLPVLVADEASFLTIALAVVIPGAIQFVIGQLWENKLLGDKFGLRASIVLLGLVFWGHIWGIVGMVLATPITAVMKTMMQGWDLTRPVARLMGPPLDEAEGPEQGTAT